MKIAVVLDSAVPSGGGFNQSLSALRQLSEICAGVHDLLVVTTKKENLPTISRLGIAVLHLVDGVADRLAAKLFQTSWGGALSFRLRCLPPFEKALIEAGVDLCYFLSPSYIPLSFQRLNYVVTVWDLCHQSHPEFPEVRAFGEFGARERLYSALLPSAFAIIADSDVLKKQILAKYAVSPERVVPMPFSPSPFAVEEIAGECTDGSVCKYDRYFFYPAQYWAHKNHIRILEALAILAAKRVMANVVFCGGDKGQREYLQRQASRLGVDAQAEFLGFVSNCELVRLYRNCTAVVMPSYFGPTNLPPLEAWSYGKPLVYSAHLHEQAGNAAVLIDPDSAGSLADALLHVSDPEFANDLVVKGRKRLGELALQRTEGELQLQQLLHRFDMRCRTWRQDAKE